ncbi:hypothetical protein NBRC3257_3153 [Gluconobacter thailandicus NBRC 3257]|uniref:Uncharacterized protein n=1 Tax=Gluconobacter thailandicus NBRC 3257 TaxID=1381097 RepID=A0ABQ0J130_GLUTH|nr:hypothetical protein NBRC3257_3153 [Gluconobacter thailandicus NBRC 3257]
MEDFVDFRQQLVVVSRFVAGVWQTPVVFKPLADSIDR